MAMTIKEIQEAYITFFNRAADKPGLVYWLSYPGDQKDLFATFAVQLEYIATFDGLTPEESVNLIYQNLFGRDAETEGLAYWSGRIKTGAVSKDTMAFAISQGAQGQDKLTFEATVAAAILATDAQIVLQVQDGPTFELTTGVDELLGTAKNDLFLAVVDVEDATKTTLTSDDSIIDASNLDFDVLNIATNGHIGQEHTATIKGIETINVRLNAITTADGQEFKLAIDNIDKSSKVHVQNVAPISVINRATVTGDQGVALEFDQAFQFVSTDTTSNSSIKLNAKGTMGAAASVTMDGAAKNVSVDAAGHVLYTAESATGLLTLKASDSATVSGAKHVAASLNAGGNMTLVNLAEAAIVNANAGGSIVATEANALSKASTLQLKAGQSITATKLKVTTDAEVAAKNTIVLAEDNADNLKSVKVTNLANTALTVDMVGVGTGLTSIQTLGGSDIVMSLNAAKLGSLNSMTKGNAGRLDIHLAGQAGDADLSFAAIDSVKLGIDNVGKTLTLATGQELTVAEAQGSAASASTIASKTANGSLTLKLDDGKRDGVAVDMINVTLRNFKDVTIDASIDATAAGKASRSKIDQLTLGATDATDVVIQTGINGIDLGTVTLTPANQLVITGSGPVNAASATIVASKFDAGAVTGAVNLKVDGAKLGQVITGSGNDTIVVASLAANMSITTGAGNDTIDLTAATGATATKFVTITDFAVNGPDGKARDILKGFGDGEETDPAIAIVGITQNSSTVVQATPTDWANTNGVLSKAGATLADFVSTMASLNTDKDNKAGLVAAFASGSDLFIYSTGADGSTADDDVMVKLVGLGQSGVGLEATASTSGFVTIGA